MQAAAETTDAVEDAIAQPLTLDEELSREAALQHCNELFAKMSAEERVAWSLKNLPAQPVLSSSFGAQAAVSLHLVTQQRPDIPVIFIDTGYLFPETYQFVDELTERLGLNLQVYRNVMSPAWQEARHGKRWLKAASTASRRITTGQQGRADGTRAAGSRRRHVVRGFAAQPVRLRRNGTQRSVNWSGNACPCDRWKVHADRGLVRQATCLIYLTATTNCRITRCGKQGYVSIGDMHTTQARCARSTTCEKTPAFSV